MYFLENLTAYLYRKTGNFRKNQLKTVMSSRKYQTNDGYCWWWKPYEGTELPVVQIWGNVWTCLKTQNKPFVWPSWRIGIFLQFFWVPGPVVIIVLAHHYGWDTLQPWRNYSLAQPIYFFYSNKNKVFLNLYTKGLTCKPE